jgi:hypothetical protein
MEFDVIFIHIQNHKQTAKGPRSATKTEYAFDSIALGWDSDKSAMNTYSIYELDPIKNKINTVIYN